MPLPLPFFSQLPLAHLLPSYAHLCGNPHLLYSSLFTSAFRINPELLEVETALHTAQDPAHNRCSINICRMLLNESLGIAYFGARNHVDTIEIQKGVNHRILSILFSFTNARTFRNYKKSLRYFLSQQHPLKSKALRLNPHKRVKTRTRERIF